MSVKVWNIEDQKFQLSPFINQSALQKNVSSLVKLVVNLPLIKRRELKLVQNESLSCKPKKSIFSRQSWYVDFFLITENMVALCKSAYFALWQFVTALIF